ncbi:MAG: UDP-N-acetylglucosamine 1-carboxyvinyltransferase [Deltaproteobacteria bacterium]|nr:UDP-N-acetylglucosamine 1-carboxyvinyltransferase [Deltaproteobacteria bacterium]
MDRLVIRGGCRLAGEVRVSGAKNAALPAIASACLTRDPVTLRNMPSVKDVDSTILLMKHMGAKAARSRDGRTVTIDPSGLNRPDAPYDLVRKMRASSLVLGPLVARFGEADVSLPGGCAIGARPINLHLKALEAMGAEMAIEHGYVRARARRLRGARIVFDTVTVTGTENIMMAATLADGRTVIENAAREPEVCDVADLLRSMGARIDGDGTDVITVDGADVLHGTEHAIIPDRIEAGTFMTAAAITRGRVAVTNIVPAHVDAVAAKLLAAGADVKFGSNKAVVSMKRRPRGVDIMTQPFPGFPTDMQAQFMALMCTADGASVVRETIFENRFMHVQELQRMGADIQFDVNTAFVKGVKKLSGAQVMATDLRASASLILAGLAAEGETVVNRIYHLDRGYEHLENKLKALGADVKRVRR